MRQRLPVGGVVLPALLASLFRDGDLATLRAVHLPGPDYNVLLPTAFAQICASDGAGGAVLFVPAVSFPLPLLPAVWAVPGTRPAGEDLAALAACAVSDGCVPEIPG